MIFFLNIGSNIRLFADDTSLYIKVDNPTIIVLILILKNSLVGLLSG